VSRVEAVCPSCGAKIPFETSISATAICAYCRTLVMRDDQAIKDLGKVGALLADGSPIQIGAEGRYGSETFIVVGRLQMDYGQGVWNEWYLFFNDGKPGWLGEAQGLYALSFLAQVDGKLPLFKDIELEEKIAICGVPYVVRDKRRARYASAEGQLPFAPKLGVEVAFADLGSADSHFATLDYDAYPPQVYLGHYVDFAQFEFKNLRSFEGW
jgi:hypothetical protein